MPESNFELTVSGGLWHEIADACGAPFADSYLTGAKETVGTLMPRTVTAFVRLRAKPAAMDAIRARGLELVTPLPFGHPSRPEPVGKDIARLPWRPLTDEEYNCATLTAKIDHHRGMQFRAEMKAGPMWRGGMSGGPVGPERLSPKWHEWRAKAANHRDEARRLWALLVGDDPNARRAPMHAQQRTTEPAETRPSPPAVHGPLDDRGVSLAMRELMARKADPTRQSA